ncbi:MAG TPA: HlyD family secretion protein [Rhizomicrobium sp.]|jgi:membrane fusion protein (multidrug efflux system)|nr:HlyD family secretion protein [Rhizomicrobium sp.]
MAAIQTDTVSPYAGTAGDLPRAPGLRERLRADKNLLRRVLMIGGVGLVVIGSLAFWLLGDRYVGTDDSYVHAAQLLVSTDVSGLVQDVDVHQGEHVKAGQVLFRIDPRQFQIALDNAEANLGQTRLTLLSMQDDYRRMLKDIAAQASQVALDQVTFNRYAALLRLNSIAQAQYDQARFTLATAQSMLASLKDQAQVQLAKLGGNIAIPVERLPQYLQAKAQVDEAQRQLEHSTVRAPFNGIVTEVDSLQPGTLVVSALSAFTTTSAVGLVSTNNEWVEANMKETDLTHVHIGDPVDVTIDSYPGRVWEGEVSSISPTTGADFSVLPAENASGNWVKVTQRVTVKIRLDLKPGDPPLRAGMSTYVSIDTGHRRWFRLLYN